MACDVLHVPMFFFSVQQISRPADQFSFQTVDFPDAELHRGSLLVIVTLSIVRPPLLLDPHPIVDHAALLLVKRGSYLGKGGPQRVLMLY